MIATFLLLTSTALGEAPPAIAEPAKSALADCSNEALVEEATAAYREGLAQRDDAATARRAFQRAADAYRRLEQRGVGNTDLYRNLAQAELLAGDLPRAIRAYRLGLRLAPHDEALQAGLAYARDQVAYPATGALESSCRPRERRALIRWLAYDSWLQGAAALYFLGWLAAARAWMTRRLIWKLATSGLLVAGAGLAAWAYWEREQLLEEEQSLPTVVVAENGTPLHRGNGVDYSLRLNDKLPAGAELRVLSERGGWRQVQLAGGEIGWVDAARVLAVGPN
jgi:hypothetical protein